VIGRGAHEGEAEGDVDRLGEGERLCRDECLVVIHAERGIVTGPCLLREHRIRGKRAEGVDVFGAKPHHRRADNALVLVAESAAFAGVRVEPGDRQPRLANGETAPEIAGEDPRRLHDQLLVQRGRHLAERNVNGDRDCLQLRTGEHHHGPPRRPGPGGRQRAEEFRVAGMAEAGVVERLLVDRVGDHRRRGARADIADRPCDRLDHRRGGDPVDHPRRRPDGGVETNHRQRRRERRLCLPGQDCAEGHVQSEAARPLRQHVDIGKNVESRQAQFLPAHPSGKRHVGTDSTRFAHGQGKRQSHRQTPTTRITEIG
jgi:hypothetical protein